MLLGDTEIAHLRDAGAPLTFQGDFRLGFVFFLWLCPTALTLKGSRSIDRTMKVHEPTDTSSGMRDVGCFEFRKKKILPSFPSHVEPFIRSGISATPFRWLSGVGQWTGDLASLNWGDTCFQLVR